MLKKYTYSVIKSISLIFCFALIPSLGFSYQATDFNWIPPFLAKDEKPTITIIYDSSGSMQFRAYGDGTKTIFRNFNSTYEYYGYFDPKKYYTHDGNYFEESNSITNSANGELWNGNFLNWACMTRDDIGKKILTGGIYDNNAKLYSFTNLDEKQAYTQTRYNDKSSTLDLNGNKNYMTPKKIHNSQNRNNADSTYIFRSDEYLYINYSSSTSKPSQSNRKFKLKLRPPSPPDQAEGIIDQFKDKARMALFKYHYDGNIKGQNNAARKNQGAKIISYVAENATEIMDLKSKLNKIHPSGSTPLAESLYTVAGYIAQDSTYSQNYGPIYNKANTIDGASYVVTKGEKGDPYYFSDLEDPDLVYCTNQVIILVTDGESTRDEGINLPKAPSKIRKNFSLSDSGTDYIQDVAWYLHTTDLRDDIGGTQTATLYTIFASFGEIPKYEDLLRRATYLGSFRDKNKDGVFDAEDLVPDDVVKTPNYFRAEDGHQLEAAIYAAFQSATSTSASGTAAAVTSQTSSGEGATYQALFYPPTDTDEVAPPWSGQVHGFLVDAQGNMREDTNQNRKLDLIDDRIIQFNDEGKVLASLKIDSDGTLIDPEELALENVKFLWSSTPWLNSITQDAIKSNRSYNEVANKRHIFTFVDKNNDMVAQPDEVVDFVYVEADCDHEDNFCSYLTLYEDNIGQVASDKNLSQPQLRAFAKRQINFIRGQEIDSVSDLEGSGIDDNVRSRTINGIPWRLGDIIYSSPTVVSRPTENYHLIYKDKTYEDFAKKYLNRRQVVYTGANDGMLHAFNAGFYNATRLSDTARGGFELTGINDEVPHPLGAELWAYIPYNLLPHLKWLMHEDYGVDLHAAYMDLKPRIFDARIFPSDEAHPHGWGTVLVAGMRLGGAEIGVDTNKDGTADRTASSAYVVMDITNPEDPPTVLGEIRMPNQGFATCYPTVMPMSTSNTNNPSNDDNEWYLVFGSGPANAVGKADRTLLGIETSAQAGNLYVVDLKALASEGILKSVDGNSKSLVQGGSVFATVEDNSFISDPIAVDLDLGHHGSAGEFKTDVIYFGTVSGGQTDGQGTLRRLLTKNSLSVLDWQSTILININKPVVVAPTAVMDDDRPYRLWVYFGTGRFFSRDDIPQLNAMTFYGVKEPVHLNGTMSWGTVNHANLFDSSKITLDNLLCVGSPNQNCVQVKRNGSLLTGAAGPPGSWRNLTTAVAEKSGWKVDFDKEYERVLGQAAALGGVVLFTSYTPSNIICSFAGTSSLWGLYYKTGTAFYRPILGLTNNIFDILTDLGEGMASTPSLHVGEGGLSASGSKAFIQLSTGAIKTVDIETPEKIKSGVSFWRENPDE